MRPGLIDAGHSRPEQFARVGEDEVSEFHGLRGKAVDRLRSALDAKGLSSANGKS